MSDDILPHATGRIVLRRLDPSDLTDFQAYRCDPAVARYQGWETLGDEEARWFLVAVNAGALLQPDEWCQIGIALASTDKLIGDIGLFVSADQTEAEIGISLSRGMQGQGLAGEAFREAMHLVFEHTGVNRLLGITDVRNGESIRLLERVGMRRVGEQESVVKNETCSEVIFAVSRGEATSLDR